MKKDNPSKVIIVPRPPVPTPPGTNSENPEPENQNEQNGTGPEQAEQTLPEQENK